MKARLLITVLAFAMSAAAHAGPAKVTDINQALTKSKEEGKMLFLQFGREACGNCQALKGYIKAGSVQLSGSKFVYADVNCDDSATSKAFYSKFKVKGTTLPFVVIASPDGTQLASRTGYGSPQEYAALIKEAGKAAKK